MKKTSSRKKKKKPTIIDVLNAIIISDIHAGCKLAICPEYVRLDEGGTYHISRFQRILLDCWNVFWTEWVPRVTRDEPYVLILNGDAMDHRHHNSTTQISQNTADQQNIAYELLAPKVDKAAAYYHIRGTEAHTGPSGEEEEKLAKRLGAVKDEAGNSSRYELFVTIGDCLLHCTHHIGVTGSMAYETTALMKELAESFSNAPRWRERAPDVVARSHRHRHAEVRIPTANIYGYCFTTSGWQLKTPFVFRGLGRIATPMIGGSLVRQGDEEFFTRHKTWPLKRPRVEAPRVEVK